MSVESYPSHVIPLSTSSRLTHGIECCTCTYISNSRAHSQPIVLPSFPPLISLHLISIPLPKKTPTHGKQLPEADAGGVQVKRGADVAERDLVPGRLDVRDVVQDARHDVLRRDRVELGGGEIGQGAGELG